MNITNIKVSIRHSRQLIAGDWATVELGADAVIDPSTTVPWTSSQTALYNALKAQLAELFSTRQLQGSAHEHTELPPTESRLDRQTGEIEHRCPTHKISKESRKGGFYCPGKTDNGDYCPWTHP